MFKKLIAAAAASISLALSGMLPAQDVQEPGEIAVSWQPFYVANSSLAETKTQVRWAFAQYGKVSGLSFAAPKSGQQTDLLLAPSNSPLYGGSSIEDEIQISLHRSFNARQFLLGGIVLRHIGHTKSKYAQPGWPDSPLTATQDSVMHPWGSSTDWFSPYEVKLLQKRFGPPSKPFKVHELEVLGKRLKDHFAQYEKLVNKSKTDPSFKRVTNNTLTRLKFDAVTWKALSRRWVDVAYAIVPGHPTNKKLDLTVIPSVDDQDIWYSNTGEIAETPGQSTSNRYIGLHPTDIEVLELKVYQSLAELIKKIEQEKFQQY